MRRLTVGSLFSGIGGIDLGLERAGMETRWFSEIDPYAVRVLAKHWPEVPNHGDITQIDFATVEPVDVLAGGFPCQDLSRAGAKEGIHGERSGLWWEYVRAIGQLRPRYVFVENVSDLLTRGFGDVLGSLAALGYDVEWDCIPASAVDAPHRRDRLWIVAYHDRLGSRTGARLPVFPRDGLSNAHRSSRRGSSTRGNHVADPNPGPRNHRADPHSGDGRAVRRSQEQTRGCDSSLRSRPGAWLPEPEMGRVVDGFPDRVEQLRGLGNAVVPQIPELIGRWIVEHARRSSRLYPCSICGAIGTLRGADNLRLWRLDCPNGHAPLVKGDAAA